MAPSTSNPRVLQLPKFAVVDVMIGLNGRECLSSEKWEVKDAFWKAVLYKLNQLYPDNVSEVRTINHVKRTWSALRQRVLQRFQTHNREVLPSDLRVLYLLGEVDSYEEKPVITCEISNQQRLNIFENNYYEEEEENDSLYDEEPIGLNYEQPKVEPKSAKKDLKERLIRCQIEREKAKTALIKAKRRLVEARLRNFQKNGNGVNLLLSIEDPLKN